MKTLLTMAALFAGAALLPATVQADGGHGHSGHQGGHHGGYQGGHHGHHGGGGQHGGWGQQHNHHHGHYHHYQPYYGNYGCRPVYRTYPYSTGFSVGTPNVWIQSGW